MKEPLNFWCRKTTFKIICMTLIPIFLFLYHVRWKEWQEWYLKSSVNGFIIIFKLFDKTDKYVYMQFRILLQISRWKQTFENPRISCLKAFKYSYWIDFGQKIERYFYSNWLFISHTEWAKRLWWVYLSLSISVDIYSSTLYWVILYIYILKIMKDICMHM